MVCSHGIDVFDFTVMIPCDESQKLQKWIRGSSSRSEIEKKKKNWSVKKKKEKKGFLQHDNIFFSGHIPVSHDEERKTDSKDGINHSVSIIAEFQG